MKPSGATHKATIVAKGFSSSLINPKWPSRKVKFLDFILNRLPILKIGVVNKMVAKNDHLTGVPFIEGICREAGIKVHLTGEENLPKRGPVTIVANHPGGADILATIVGLGKMRHDLAILANKLICIEPVRDIVIPIDMMASQKVDSALVHEAYRQGKVVVFYASGKNSRYNDKGLLRDRRWRTTFMEYAKQYNTPINVLRIGGKNSSLFYKVSEFRARYKSLKNVPLENMFQLREILLSKGIVELHLSKSVSFPPEMEGTHRTAKQIIRNQTDALYDFIYTMDENNLTFK